MDYYQKRRRKMQRKRRRIRRICKCIIFLSIVFTIGCLIYLAAYTIIKPEPEDPELVRQVNEIAEYYENKKRLSNEPIKVYDTESKKMQQQTEEPLNTEEQEHMTSGMERNREESLRELLNSVSLSPSYPDSTELREKLDELMPEITSGCKDTYDRVKACYDFLIANCCFSNTEKYTYEQDAYLLLTQFQGSCTYYAAAFHYMMLYLGLNDRLVSSYRYLETGESFHRWNEITINGIPYVFDTQWEDTLSHGEEHSYSRFCMTHEEVRGYYIFD